MKARIYDPPPRPITVADSIGTWLTFLTKLASSTETTSTGPLEGKIDNRGYLKDKGGYCKLLRIKEEGEGK